MRLLGRLIVVLFAGAGALVFAQFPEFAQQYRQRLGGALTELRDVVADFDRDAARNRLTREQALDTFDTSRDSFLRDRGTSTRTTLGRYDRLLEQRLRMEAAPPLLRPVVVLNRPDETTLAGAWDDFEPGAPLTTAGLVWAAVGFVFAGGAASMLRQIGGAVRRRRLRAQMQ